jgi:hypothetical protein
VLKKKKLNEELARKEKKPTTNEDGCARGRAVRCLIALLVDNKEAQEDLTVLLHLLREDGHGGVDRVGDDGHEGLGAVASHL